MRVVGQMSGTSLDGIDFVYCDIRSPEQVQFIGQGSINFPTTLRRKLILAAQQKLSMADAGKLHFELGQMYAQGFQKIIRQKRWKPELIGMHGQTIYHAPPFCTWQSGEASFVAQLLKLPVVYNFRVADVAAHGQGAPLAPIFHRFAFSNRLKNREGSFAVQNLGGISNVTFIEKAKKTSSTSKRMILDLSNVQAFDTGPANMLLNLAMEKLTHGKKSMDRGGALAAKGIADAELVNKWLKHKYFQQKPPKSTGREDFGEAYLEILWRDLVRCGVRRPEDKLATLLELTAQSIAMAYHKFAPRDLEHIFVAGGGSRNPTLIKRLRILLSPIPISPTDEVGWSTQAVEGGAFALLAYLNYHGYQLNIRTITGQRNPVSLGQLVLP